MFCAILDGHTPAQSLPYPPCVHASTRTFLLWPTRHLPWDCILLNQMVQACGAWTTIRVLIGNVANLSCIGRPLCLRCCTVEKHGKCVRMSLCLCVCASVRAGAFACACVYLLTYLTFNELLWTILTVAVVAAIRVFLLLLLFDLMLVAVCRTPLCRRCQGGKCC